LHAVQPGWGSLKELIVPRDVRFDDQTRGEAQWAVSITIAQRNVYSGRVVSNPEAIETRLEEINGDLPEYDFWPGTISALPVIQASSREASLIGGEGGHF
jgi:hypothetical protein